MKMFALIIASAAFLAGCISENKTYLRAKELELKYQHQQSVQETTVEGPAELKLEQGGKATFKR